MDVADRDGLMKGFIFPLLQEQRVVLEIKADDVSIGLSSFLAVSGLRIEKSFTCRYLGLPPNPTTSSAFCPPDQVGEVVGISVECAPGESNVTRWHPGAGLEGSSGGT
eukprot:CAMPEP_0178449138 /NCGR_PEP_ID=MMETSP0689_2-20121128/42372_1 /TAXON_ID=160604 /ORGANISM="Amphidinium massartii, Strain CS-259" /LENGTH=107 /DNA_ID=CAMNT_0020074399 /DNA_START=386 /DNA_END=705 /DNA_ORIENTATION=-